jgi:hypothetical protein
MIVVGSTVGALVFGFSCWIWCCCRKRKKKNITTKKNNMEMEEMRTTSRREEKQDERRSERNDRLTDIRSKYGLGKPADDGYGQGLIDD